MGESSIRGKTSRDVKDELNNLCEVFENLVGININGVTVQGLIVRCIMNLKLAEEQIEQALSQDEASNPCIIVVRGYK